MSESREFQVPDDVVQAAIRVAGERGIDVADVPLGALAAAAGMSRSTLVRRLGGSRRALDEAVRAAGVEPGGRRPVRERAVEAGAWLIGERGLASATLDAVAEAAECSVHSLYAAFGGRDELLGAIFERYSPILDLESLAAGPDAGIEETVRGVYRAFVVSFSRKPRVMPAMLADLFGRPDGPAGPVFQRFFPRVLGSVGDWLSAEVTAGRIRPLPLPVLVQQLIGPVAVHLLLRPALVRQPDIELPTVDEACAAFADAFLRAVVVPGAETGGTGPTIQ